MKDLAAILARLQEIAAKIESFASGELTDEQVAEANALHTEFEQLNARKEALEKVEAMKAKVSASTRQTTNVTPAATTRTEVVREANDRFGGFKSSGDFLMAVKADAGGHKDKIFMSPAYEKYAEDGGYLIPEDISSEILEKLKTDESLFSKCTTFNVGGNALSLPVDEAQPWNSGVVAYWVDEGKAYTGSKGVFKKAEWKLKKLGALVEATEEMLEDATAMESYIKKAAPAAIMHKLNAAIISGDGAGKPKGLLNSGFTVQAAKESMQTADTINARNIINMYTRMLPQARANAAWYINAGAEPQLLTLKDDLGNFIYLSPGSQMNNSPYGLLLGRPVIPMMSTLPALGDAGDILFMDLSYYYAITKTAGVKQQMSIHLKFDQDISTFKFTFRVDGNVPFTTPVTTEYGSYQMSAFVKLEAR